MCVYVYIYSSFFPQKICFLKCTLYIITFALIIYILHLTIFFLIVIRFCFDISRFTVMIWTEIMIISMESSRAWTMNISLWEDKYTSSEIFNAEVEAEKYLFVATKRIFVDTFIQFLLTLTLLKVKNLKYYE